MASEVFEDYLRATHTTAVYAGAGAKGITEKAYLALGLAGESGEAVDCIKKIVRDCTNRDHVARAQNEEKQREKLRGELGDVMWYWTRLCWAFGFDPDDILEENKAKLQKRKETNTLKTREG